MNLLSSETAASEVIGHLLILFITILGVGMIALYGVPAIYSLEDMANSKNSEQAFTVLDSRASRVTLGESPLQITNINLGGGTMTVEPNSTSNPSYMVVNSSSFNVTIPMGRVKYTLGDRTVAYEGGGVWAQYPGGGTVMLSPPEIHFNGWTLTLPVINIYGNSSVGGKGTAVVSFKKNATLIQFPNTSWINRTNPVPTDAGKVYVNVTSDYYLAWADYARSLGYTKVSTNSTTHAANIELTVVPSTLGQNTSLSNPTTFRGLDPSDSTPLESYSFRIYGSPPSGNLNSLDWQMEAKSGTKRLVIQIKKGSGNNIDIKVGYTDTSFVGSKKAEAWEKDGAFKIISGGTEYADIDLLNQSIVLTYKDIDVPAGNACWSEVDDVNTSSAFSWLPSKVINTSTSNPQSLFNVTQHYFQLLAPDVVMNRCSPGSSDPTNIGTSTMLVNYTAIGALTYLHITENRADVGIN